MRRSLRTFARERRSRAISPNGAANMAVVAPLSTTRRSPGERPARRADAVVSDLLERIVSGDLRPADLVPTEPALCDAYGVSRTVAREAVKTLEEKGLVTARQGIGTLVSSQEAWNLLDPEVLAAIVRHDEEYEVLDQLIVVRTVLESALAREAARRRTADDLRELNALMDELDTCVREPERMNVVDVAFHERIMLVSGNQLARAIVKTVHAEARRSTRYSGYVTVANRQRTNLQHRGILDAIAAGDSELAASLMMEHITDAWRRRRPRSKRPSTRP
jgi:DNA-binding FadR family transcriptional regulator